MSGFDSRRNMLSRYSRQMIMPVIGVEGQNILSTSKVLVIGAGGIGSTVLMYLASSGIPVNVLDFDSVEASNLHRQIIHDTPSQGINKAISAIDRLNLINPTLKYSAITEKLSCQNAESIISQYDVIVDATDNFEARYIINDACVIHNKPLVSGSAVGLEGQATVFIPGSSACYRCLYPRQSFAESCRSCANAGVLGPVPGLIGCIQAIETIKLLLKNNVDNGAANQLDCLVGRQTVYDASVGSFHTFMLPSRSLECAVCGSQPTILSLQDTEKELQQVQCDNASVMSTLVPTLKPENCKSVIQFRDYIIESRSTKKPVIVLDVRSQVQFELSSFILSDIVAGDHGEYISTFTSTGDCLKHLESQQCINTTLLISVPLEILKGGKGPIAVREENKHSQVNNIHTILKLLEVSEVFVLCRRGIDSSTASQLLLDELSDKNVSVFNVTGGLTAWKNEVEASLPFY